MSIPTDTLVTITNQAGERPWAKSFPSDPVADPAWITLDTEFGQLFQQWQISAFDEGYTIKNEALSSLAAGQGTDEVACHKEFNPSTGTWLIEAAGDGLYVIKSLSEDLVWTAHRHDPDLAPSVSLRPYAGGREQQWAFETDPVAP
ncbi:RICIN domain-containing protein [Nocardia sp. NPDC003693]